MRTAAITLLALVVTACGGDGEEGIEYRELGPVTLSVMTFNVLCSFCNNAEYDPWADRVGFFADIIERHDPDLVGFQEFFLGEEVFQVAEILEDYDYLYFSDSDGPFVDDYPDSLIFYRRELFEVIDSGYYWLSATPDEAWSTGWSDGQIWRLVAWAQLRHRADGGDLYFATTHFDNNHPNQQMSAPLLLERTARWAELMPVIVVGDFNSKPDSEAYATLVGPAGGAPGFPLQNTFDIAADWSVEHNQPTDPTYEVDQRIDHIFVAGQAQWSCSSWRADLFTYGDQDRYPSDHFALSAVLSTQ